MMCCDPDEPHSLHDIEVLHPTLLLLAGMSQSLFEMNSAVRNNHLESAVTENTSERLKGGESYI